MGVRMNRQIILDEMIAEYEKEFKGWDFSYLNGKWEESKEPWNYRQIVEEALKGKNTLLDLGTGGGEFLSSLQNLPQTVYATEGYEPNFQIAEDRLKKLGITVKFITDNEIPYDSEQFDIVINKHESYEPAEVHRVLKNNGIFITQQVGGLNDCNLNSIFKSDLSEYRDWELFAAVKALEEQGFSIERRQESFGYTRFFEAKSLVYYLKCIPWQIKGFSVMRYAEPLLSLHSYIDENGFIDLIKHRFLIITKKLG
ncbi:MAG: class I SAM-dependent methyltransferase [Sphaerochaetaceae bacterium]